MFGRTSQSTTKSAGRLKPAALLGVLAVSGLAAWTALAASPAPTITSSPSNPTKATSATFTYTLAGAAGFLCKLDAAAFTTCAKTGASYTGLAPGSHTFQVEAADKNGKASSAASSYSWVIDTTAPGAPAITSGPSGLVNSSSATFAFNGEPGAKFQCALESTAGPVACTSPVAYSGLAQGSHTVYVRQIDAAGNVGAQFASRSWTVDSVAPPAPVIGTKPEDPNGDGIANFDWTDAEPGVTYRCSIENKPPATCTTPFRTIVDVSNDGQHQFAVSAVDDAGNVSTTTYVWKVLKAVNVVVDGDAVGLLYPGGPTRQIALTLHNPNNFAVLVTSIDASVKSSPAGCPAAASATSPANLELQQSNVGHGASPQTVTVAANQNLTLPAGGAIAPTVKLLNYTDRNQDACKNGSFVFNYTATGGK
ncbi:MAG TPA: hypothetical protein VNT03_08435 [Baekduia sp.]|nr:hypothetical protein [Baekduia sp.]